jgi:hypothetical protein
MSEGTHTPGPWFVTYGTWDGDGDATYTLRGIKTIGQADANLIAAAPDLLAALRLLHSEASDPARGFVPSLPCVAIVEAALAKVRQ